MKDDTDCQDKKNLIYTATITGEFALDQDLLSQLTGNDIRVLLPMIQKTSQVKDKNGNICQKYPVKFTRQDTAGKNVKALPLKSYHRVIYKLIDLNIIEAYEPNPIRKDGIPIKFRICFMKQLHK